MNGRSSSEPTALRAVKGRRRSVQPSAEHRLAAAGEFQAEPQLPAGSFELDPVVAVHLHERRDVQRLGESPAAARLLTGEHVPVALLPWRVGHLEHDRLVGGSSRSAEVHRQRVEDVAERAQVGEHRHRPPRPLAETIGDQVAHEVLEWAVSAVAVVGAAQPDRGRAAR